MVPQFSDYRERRQIIRQIYPDDLLEDLKDKEPELYREALMCDYYLAKMRPHLENTSVQTPLLPSLLTRGWDRPKRQKFAKNWPDMENLLKLYAIGLYFENKDITYQAIHDQKELEVAIQQASVCPKYKNGICPKKRLQKAKTYLAFGLRTLRTYCQPDSIEKEDDIDALNETIQQTGNEYKAKKLIRSRDMALRVWRQICMRYQ